MSKKKAVFITAIALLIGLLSVGIASADSLAGRGWVRAKGSGTAVVSGNVATLTMTGSGSLMFKDEGEPDEPLVSGFEYKIEYPNGWVEYVGFRGKFHLDRADGVTVKMTGRKINLLAAGTGRVYLQGRGGYVYGTGEQQLGFGNWAPDEIAVDFGD